MASATNSGRFRPRPTPGLTRAPVYEAGTVLPGGLLIPAGLDTVMADLIGQVNSPDHGVWMGQVARIGGCSHPLHLKGFTRVRHSVTGAVDYEFSSREAPGGVVLARCRNRRAAVCPSCARLYQGDVYHLVRSGLEGGKGIPLTVACHPRVFATLTAPSFGAVHTSRVGTGGSERGGPCHPRRSPVCEHGRKTACFARHTDDDPVVGTPLCADCYDYKGAVIWQASVGNLWWRFCTYLRRHLGSLGGRTVAQVRAEVRLSYVKIVEFQRRGLVHIHAVIRADGIADDESTDGDDAGIVEPPGWVTAELLCEAVRSSADAVRVEVDGGQAGSWVLGWGQELTVDDLRISGETDAAKTSAYVAKYATKSTEVTGWDASGREDTPRAIHTAAMARTAYALAEVPELEGLRLGRWVKELSYRGHVSSKSRRYSTTLGKLRAVRAEHRAAAGRIRAGKKDPASDGYDGLMITESHWELTGFGYSPGQALLAEEVARDVAVNREAGRDAADGSARGAAD
jgi:replication initiator protein RepSA